MIRLAQPDDVSAIRACAEAAYEKYVGRIGRKPAPMVAEFENQIRRQQIHVFEGKAGEVLGFIVFYRRDDHMHLENVAVTPRCHGKGVGRQLVLFCEEAARAADLKSVELYTNAKMTENLSLYPALGYQETGRRRQDGFDRVFFCKKFLG